MIKKNCKYIDCEGVCILENKVCNSCEMSQTIKYVYQYNPLKNTTGISILDRGRALISAELYGQMSEAYIREYAMELCRILIKKGVIR